MAKNLNRIQIIDRVNAIPRLKKKFKYGSWDYYAGKAGVFPVGREEVPNYHHITRDLYSPDAVQKIASVIGFKTQN